MPERLRIALAQLNPVVGDLSGNAAKILDARAEAGDADLVVTPELSVSGYPPEDLVLRPSYVDACMKAAAALAQKTVDGPGVIVGCPWKDDGHADRPYNAALLLDRGKVAGVARKVHLPNYGPFDEPRTFAAGPSPQALKFRGWQLGLMVCEDMWFPHVSRRLKEAGADMLIAPHGSPFRRNVKRERRDHAEARSLETGLPLFFVNQVGGQDELVFDGGSFAVSAGRVRGQLPLFVEKVQGFDIVKDDGSLQVSRSEYADWPEDEALVYEAVLVGTRDYVLKSGFRQVVLGLSGGIDSALVAAIAVDALGAANVHCVRLPSRYTSEASMTDAEACAKALGTRLDTIPIEPGVEAMTGMLAGIFAGRQPGLAEENIQSRLRGTALMAISNKLGSMMLTTGNKSEMAVGYATLYGDMNGGYNPLKDVYKVDVFRLARWRNANKPDWALGPGGEVIPEAIIAKPPSAELREDQKDEDSLPPYEVLDAILHGLVEEEASVDAIASRGFDEELVRRIQTMLFRAEYKRRQSAPGPKVSTRYFGRDRRYPIVNRFTG
ncbi:NAD+ synthase [Parvularcula lutaonensis]|uniref:Glutamine-dependent NAD(+) synthetase n=1 Tax=Parvularcula lutaonensis TaxID=491923 RepID=A0ABV7MDE5_9PROT|nr:NAD+ synthase [Parvularcula lutaonensis]GGY51183.1 NAD+ synthase [Parvularcula lutaonensis]